MPAERTSTTTVIEEGPNKGPCEVCGKFFPRDLRRHKRIHSDKRMFKCPYDYCNHKGFNQRQNMLTHVTKWHLGTRPWKCPDSWVDELGEVSPCAFTFDDRASLSRHRTGVHSHEPHERKQISPVKRRSSKKQKKDRYIYEVVIPKLTREKLIKRWKDVPGAVGPWSLPVQDDGVPGPAASEASEAATMVISSASSSSSGSASSESSSSAFTRASGSPSSDSSQFSAPSSQGTFSSSQDTLSSSQSSLSSFQGFSSSSQNSFASAQGSSAVTSGSSSLVSPAIHTLPRDPHWSFIPRPANMPSPTSLIRRLTGSNDPFLNAPYAISPVGTLLSQPADPPAQYPPFVPQVTAFQPQVPFGQPDAFVPNQFPDPGQFMPMQPYPPSYPGPPTLGWDFQEPIFRAPYPGPLLDHAMGMNLNTNMGAALGTGLGMPRMNTQNMLPFGMPRVPFAAQPGFHSEGWATQGFSRESSPSGSSSSSVTSSPRMSRRWRREQEALPYRYVQ